jgi:hypothetical protein
MTSTENGVQATVRDLHISPPTKKKQLPHQGTTEYMLRLE